MNSFACETARSSTVLCSFVPSTRRGEVPSRHVSSMFLSIHPIYINTARKYSTTSIFSQILLDDFLLYGCQDDLFVFFSFLFFCVVLCCLVLVSYFLFLFTYFPFFFTFS